MPKISVIIPIHGTEAYVEKCVRSVMAQTLHEIEILCIDDCSPDNSAAIVERLAAEDSRVRLIRHDRNLGLGGARNTGIEAARAPYLASVDSDDFIEPDMLERLWGATQGGLADIVACGISIVTETGAPIRTVGPKAVGWHENDADQLDIFSLVNPAFWNKLWRTSLFTDSDIRFPEHLYYEDLATTPRVLHGADNIHIISDPLYHYVTRKGSITSRVSEKHIQDYFKVFEILWSFLARRGLIDRYSDEFSAQMGKELHYHASIALKSNLSREEKTLYLRHMLMLKVGFLDHAETLRVLDARSLQGLLLNAGSGADIK